MTEKQICRIITELTNLIAYIADQNFSRLHEDAALDMAVDFYEKTLSPILNCDPTKEDVKRLAEYIS